MSICQFLLIFRSVQFSSSSCCSYPQDHCESSKLDIVECDDSSNVALQFTSTILSNQTSKCVESLNDEIVTLTAVEKSNHPEDEISTNSPHLTELILTSSLLTKQLRRSRTSSIMRSHRRGRGGDTIIGTSSNSPLSDDSQNSTAQPLSSPIRCPNQSDQTSSTLR